MWIFWLLCTILNTDWKLSAKNTFLKTVYDFGWFFTPSGQPWKLDITGNLVCVGREIVQEGVNACWDVNHTPFTIAFNWMEKQQQWIKNSISELREGLHVIPQNFLKITHDLKLSSEKKSFLCINHLILKHVNNLTL